MLKIDFPKPSFNIKKTNNKDYIFDIVRKKWILLTPEEWVRQNLVAYLTQSLQYPISLLAVEKEINVNGLKRRCDIVVYSNSKPWMIIECKEPKVALNENVLTQILHYNITLDVPYLIISNGNYSFGWSIEYRKPVTLASFPSYVGVK